MTNEAGLVGSVARLRAWPYTGRRGAMRKLLITGDFDIPRDISEVLGQRFVISHLRHITEKDSLIEALHSATYYILGGPEYVDAELLNAAKDLRGIILMGTGIPSFIDAEAARANGVRLQNTPGRNADAVAEFAAAMLVVINASVFLSWEGVRTGAAWFQGVRKSLGACTVGLVGMGNVGTSLATKLRALAPGIKLLYWSRSRRPAFEASFRADWVDLKTMFAQADLCSVQLAYHHRDTHHLIGSHLLSYGRGELRLLNFSNPKIIDPAALKDALQAGHLAYAYMDGYYREWIENRGLHEDPYELLKFGPQRFAATSHVAALTREAICAIFQDAAAHLLAWAADGIDALKQERKDIARRRSPPGDCGFIVP
jgi:phosphoglycerate dehydrogenase-like enzyme